MDFVRLTAAWKLAEAHLAQAIRSDPSVDSHAALLRSYTELLDQLETYQPASQVELRDMVAFFVKRSSQLSEVGEGKRELDIAISLVGRFDKSLLPLQGKAQEPTETCIKDIEGAVEPDELAAIVSHSRDRLVAIDTNYRYLAVSESNAAFNRSTRIGMIDAHLCRIVGHERFEARAKNRLDRCFAGEPQDYVYSVDVPLQGMREIRCQMSPVRDRAGRLYCSLMRMTDVTDMTESLSKAG